MPHNDDARHWRRRAQEAMAQAKDLGDDGSKWMALPIAKGYEVLARCPNSGAASNNGAGLPHL